MKLATEIEDDEAARMIGFALDVIHQDHGYDPQFRIGMEKIGFHVRYKIAFTDKQGDRMQVSFELKNYEALTIPSDTLATIALILS
jgi:hypothetical protein